MHLSLVAKPVVDFANFIIGVPVPEDALRAHRADAAIETPPGLSEFPHVLSDWAAWGEAVAPERGWLIARHELMEDPVKAVVPLVTPHYTRAKVEGVFAAWRAAKAGRGAWRLLVEDAFVVDGSRSGDGLMVGIEPITTKRSRRHGR